jgi:pimeloyl-ACP methyl ester carboxylesterase
MRHLAERNLPLALVALALLVLASVGCSHGPRARFALWPSSHHDEYSSRAAAERELSQAAALEATGNAACVDGYFRACSLAWPAIHEHRNAAECYNVAVAELVRSAQRFGRLNPASGLIIHEGDESVTVPVVHRGFAWQPSDFQRLHPPPKGREAMLTRRYGCGGLGAPLVVERARDGCDSFETRFLPEKSFFAATAILRFDASSPVLEFHNPVLARGLPAEACSLPLATDLSAPLAQTLEEAPRTYLAGFVQAGSGSMTTRLTFWEPYQPGKVPLVLIHGLFSDPLSWADMVNDLRATPEFAERYQIWLFRYPTGQGFLQSAAALRRELRAAADALDPERRDEALRRMVLVGHSMGGLIAKLQVTHADELVWSRLANRPLEEIVATEEARTLLAETCYFDPSPDVARVIFIASPHAGSLRSSGLVGRGAALLVEPSPEQAAVHDQLVRDNPGAFNPEFEDRLPTSIDMLAPDSPLLAAMKQMRFGPGVRLHNIVGVSHPASLDGPSDGVVSVHSAKHPCCQTVLAIGAPHAKVHRSLTASEEVWRILSGGGNCPTGTD